VIIKIARQDRITLLPLSKDLIGNESFIHVTLKLAGREPKSKSLVEPSQLWPRVDLQHLILYDWYPCIVTIRVR
jgi:hypothetical protein